MAFYAEMCRRRWYCVKGMQLIRWYKRKLYDDWWNSLTDEEKEIVEHNRKVREEHRQRELEESIMRLGAISAHMLSLGSLYYH